MQDVIGFTKKEHLSELIEIIDERPEIKGNINAMTSKMYDMDRKIGEHDGVLNDVDGDKFILNNKNIVCGCIGICTCETRRLTTNKQIDFVTDEIKNQKQIIDKKFDDVGVTMGDLSKNIEQVHDTFD
jgi:hypothetical protein